MHSEIVMFEIEDAGLLDDYAATPTEFAVKHDTEIRSFLSISVADESRENVFKFRDRVSDLSCIPDWIGEDESSFEKIGDFLHALYKFLNLYKPKPEFRSSDAKIEEKRNKLMIRWLEFFEK